MQRIANKPTKRLALIADGDSEHRKNVCEALSTFGYKVLSADNGHAAIDLFSKTQPDVILLGSQLPGISSIECCKAIRSMHAGREIPILIFNELQDDESAVLAFKVGATDVIEGTISNTVLPHRVKNALNTARSLSDLTGLIRAIPDLIFIVNENGEVQNGLSGPGATHTLQIKALTTASQIHFYPCENDDGALACIRLALETGKPQVYEHTLIELGIHLETRFVRRNKNSVLAIVRDITERKKAEEKIYNLAYYDVLTELPNRELFSQSLEETIAASRRDNSMFAVLFLDLDRFKRINDTLGHSIGDQLLKEVSDRLLKCIRGTDSLALLGPDNASKITLARLGGDEFVIKLLDIAGEEAAVKIASRIKEVLTLPFNCEGHQFVVTPSIGIALYPKDGQTGEELLMNADSAMYSAKNVGRNNFKFFSETMRTKSLHRLDLENQIRTAIEEEQFELYFQPKIRAKDWALVGAEALLRWHHPERGTIAPSDFIPIAEETGLILPISQWVIREACGAVKRWSGSRVGAVPVSVNISSHHFIDKSILNDVFSGLKLAGIDPKFLELEITEGVFMQDVAATLTQLKSLKDAGISLAVDDFGTGYSSLGYLKRFPIDTVKIDRSFVKDIHEDADDAAICAAIIAMSQQLGLNVVAEGVETKDQLRFLRHHGCNHIQGFICSQALSDDHFFTMLDGLYRARPVPQVQHQLLAS